MKKNKVLEKERNYLKTLQIDSKVKQVLKNRALSFKSVVTQQARINAHYVLEQALKDTQNAFLNLKISNLLSKALWSNQGYQIKDTNNAQFKIFRLMNTPLKCLGIENTKNAKTNQIIFKKQ